MAFGRKPAPLLGTSAALIGTAGLVSASTGLHGQAIPAWVFAFPVLLLAALSPLSPPSPRRIGLLAALAYGIGSAGIWHYGRTSLELPVPALLGYVAVPAILFGAVIGEFAHLLRRDRPLAAALWVPVAWVSVEYLIAVATPAGTFLSLATSQIPVRPVLGLAAVTGGWGITFLLLLVQTVVAVQFAAGLPGRTRPSVVLVGVVPLLLGLAAGGWVAFSSPAPDRLRVALIALPQAANPVDPASPTGQRLLADYAARISGLTGSGAHLVVLPEKTFRVDDVTRPVVLSTLRQAGARAGVDVVVGLTDVGATTRNEAVHLPQSGTPTSYAKRHLIPVVESDYQPGDGRPVTATTAGVALRLLVCKDLDFPQLVRAQLSKARPAQPAVLVAPAWDFGTDGRLHSRVAVLRGVENGLSLARPARDGFLVLSDPQGRIVAQVRQPGTVQGAATGAALTMADLPVDAGTTVYARFGDWLAYGCLLAAALIVATGARFGRQPVQGGGGPELARTINSGATATSAFGAAAPASMRSSSNPTHCLPISSKS